ncbi:MAG TPA: HD domain-containing protein [Actinomycetes bacterium]
MDPNELVRWAEAKASTLLSDMGDRWQHVQAVAAQADEVGQVLNSEDDRAALLAAAWLHDVGYAPSIAATGFHSLDGARYVRRLGHERIAGLVAHHSAANFEAELRGLSAELAEFPDEASTATAALAYCDMLTGPTGNPVSLRKRIAGVKRRYGAGHVVYRSMVRARPELTRMIDLVEDRLYELAHS